MNRAKQLEAVRSGVRPKDITKARFKAMCRYVERLGPPRQFRRSYE